MAEGTTADPHQFAPTPPLADQLAAARDHPVMACFEGIGGSFWPDDHPVHPRLLYNCVCRFRRGDAVAYVWFEGEHWWVRPWQPLRRLSGLVERFGALGAALDWLAAPAVSPDRRRSWWPWGSRADPVAAPGPALKAGPGR